MKSTLKIERKYWLCSNLNSQCGTYFFRAVIQIKILISLEKGHFLHTNYIFDGTKQQLLLYFEGIWGICRGLISSLRDVLKLLTYVPAFQTTHYPKTLFIYIYKLVAI